MKFRKRIGLLFFIAIASNLHGQNTISDIEGCWELVSPKNSFGPEFIHESNKGITHIVVSGEQYSGAFGQYNTDDELEYAIHFIPEWDGKILTGTVSDTTWNNDLDNLKISIPLVFDSKKNTLTIQINNHKYGKVKFIYNKLECDEKM